MNNETKEFKINFEALKGRKCPRCGTILGPPGSVHICS